MRETLQVSPRVSVVIAAYNYGRYLRQSLDSLVAQTFGGWEAVVVDDGSTDDTHDVVAPYLADSRLRYYRTDHVGQPKAKNTGIRMTSAPLVAFLDADDAWLPKKLELQTKLFDHNSELGVAYTARKWMDESGRILDRRGSTFRRGDVLEPMWLNNFVCFSSSMVRRAVFGDVGLFDENLSLAIDYDLWLRVGMKYKFDYLEEPLVLYRTGHANLSKRSEERLHLVLGVMRRFVDCHGGRSRLPRGVVRRGFAETYTHIGQHARERSAYNALRWYLAALAQSPLCLEAWQSLARLAVPRPVLQWLRSRRVGSVGA